MVMAHGGTALLLVVFLVRAARRTDNTVAVVALALSGAMYAQEGRGVGRLGGGVRWDGGEGSWQDDIRTYVLRCGGGFGRGWTRG